MDVRQTDQTLNVAHGQRVLAGHSHEMAGAVAVEKLQGHGALHNAAGEAVELINPNAMLIVLVTVAASSLLMVQLFDTLVIVYLDDVQYELLIVAQQDCFAYHALGEKEGHIDGRMNIHLNVCRGQKLEVSCSSHTIVLELHLGYFACLDRVEGVTDAVLREYGQELITAIKDLVKVLALHNKFMALAAKLREKSLNRGKVRVRVALLSHHIKQLCKVVWTLQPLTDLATGAAASEECDFADKVIDVEIVLNAKERIARVPNLFRVVQLTNGYGRKRSIPIEATSRKRLNFHIVH